MSSTPRLHPFVHVGGDRYYHPLTDRTLGGSLPKGLQQISMAIQRLHLRRLKGTG